MAEFHIEYIVHLTVEADSQVEAMMIGGRKLTDLEADNELADSCEFLDIEELPEDLEMKEYRVGIFASVNVEAVSKAEAMDEARHMVIDGAIKTHDYEFEVQER